MADCRRDAATTAILLKLKPRTAPAGAERSERQRIVETQQREKEDEMQRAMNAKRNNGTIRMLLIHGEKRHSELGIIEAVNEEVCV